MFKKLRRAYHQASKWAHQHTIVVSLGLFIFSFSFAWQIIMPQGQASAMQEPTADRCQNNAGSIAISVEECETLYDLYTETTINFPNWFQSTNICRGWGNNIGCDYDSEEGVYYIRDIWFPVYGKNQNSASDYIPDLSGLSKLQRLDIRSIENSNTVMFDMSILQNLNLQRLNIQGIGIVGDANNIAHMQDMRDLSIACDFDSQLCNIDSNRGFVQNMPNIEKLRIQTKTIYNQLTEIFDMNTLQNLHQLNSLQLALNVSGDIAILANKPLDSLQIACRQSADCAGSYGDIAVLDTLPLNTQIVLESVNIYGTVPASVWTKSGIQQLIIETSASIGTMPSLIGFDNLTDIELDFGNTSGPLYLPDSRADLPNLQEITVKGQSLHGLLPATWGNSVYMQNNLRYLDIHLTNLTGLIPQSRDNLSALREIKLIGNYIDGPIPSVRQNLPLSTLQIIYNCFDTNNYANDFITFLNSTAGSQRTLQNNCKYSINIQQSISQNIINPGDIFNYYIDYTNLGPQSAKKILLGAAIDPALTIIDAGGSIAGYIGRSYFTNGDICYDQLANNTGLYFDVINQSVIGSTYGAFDAISIAPILYTQIAGIAAYNPAVHGSEGQYVFAAVCNLFGHTELTQCGQALGIDFNQNIDCGVGGIRGNIWILDKIPANQSGRLAIQVQLDPSFSLGSSIFNSVYIDGEGDNQGDNQSLLDIAVGGNGDGDGTEQSDGGGSQTNTNNSGNGGSNGGGSNAGNSGGGSTTLITDEQKGLCEIRDCSDSYYDSECGVCSTERGTQEEAQQILIDNPVEFIKEVGNIMSTMTCDIAQELVQAYVFSYDLGITTVADICQADMYGPLIRKHMAKFLSMFAIQVLDRQPDLTRVCEFADMGEESFEMQGFARIACQLGIMGLQQDGSPDTVFNPNQEVTRAMFGTALSRLIYGQAHNSPTGLRYQEHLNALQADAIMTQISNPDMLEVRGWVMIMLMRAYQWLQDNG